MKKIACAIGALLLLAACSEYAGPQQSSLNAPSEGVSDCTSGQDANFLDENQNFGGLNPYVANCSGNGY